MLSTNEQGVEDGGLSHEARRIPSNMDLSPARYGKFGLCERCFFPHRFNPCWDPPCEWTRKATQTCCNGCGWFRFFSLTGALIVLHRPGLPNTQTCENCEQQTAQWRKYPGTSTILCDACYALVDQAANSSAQSEFSAYSQPMQASSLSAAHAFSQPGISLGSMLGLTHTISNSHEGMHGGAPMVSGVAEHAHMQPSSNGQSHVPAGSYEANSQFLLSMLPMSPSGRVGSNPSQSAATAAAAAIYSAERRASAASLSNGMGQNSPVNQQSPGMMSSNPYAASPNRSFASVSNGGGNSMEPESEMAMAAPSRSDDTIEYAGSDHYYEFEGPQLPFLFFHIERGREKEQIWKMFVVGFVVDVKRTCVQMSAKLCLLQDG
jgi:hypothetical protein